MNATLSMFPFEQASWAVAAAGVAIIVAVALAAIGIRRPRVAGMLGGLILVLVGLAAMKLFFTGRHNQQVALRPIISAAQESAHQQQLARQIATMEIHALMEKADAPRIALPPGPPAPPELPDEQIATDEPDDSSGQPAQPSEHSEPTADSDEAENEATDTQAEQAESGETDAAGENANDTDAAGENPDTEERAAADDTADNFHAADARLERSTNPPVQALRPVWVDTSSKRVGNTWRNVIATDEFATKHECVREADRLLIRATYNQLQVLSGDASAVLDDTLHVSSIEDHRAAVDLAAMGITIDYIRREIAKDEYLETIERSFGPMKKLYTLVEFTPTVDRELRARWDNYRRQEHFAVVGAGAASVLALLGMAWGLLKVDTLTKGYYSKRLFLGVPLAIIAGFLALSVWFDYLF
jgi:hypothetical protein